MSKPSEAIRDVLCERLNPVTDIDGVGGASDWGVVNTVADISGDEGCPTVEAYFSTH